MRILVVNYEYPPLGGGGGVLTRSLVTELAGRHDVTILTSRAPDLPAESFEGGVRVVRAPVVGRRDLSRASLASMLSFVPAATFGSRRRLAGQPFDLVHTFFAIPSGPAGRRIARRAGVPHVLTVIGADIHDPSRISPDRFAPLRVAVTRVVRSADAVTAISNDIARRAETMTGRAAIEVVSCGVTPPAVPARDRAGLGWGERDFVVLTVGRLVARKGLDALVRAVGRAGFPLRLEVVGDGPERAGLETLAASAAPGRIAFAGSLPEQEKLRRIASADAFALVSLHEGFGLVYLEAMHAGLAVVAGNVGGQTDFLNEDNALLVSPGDVEAITSALRRLSEEPRLRRSLADAARRTAAGYTPGRMASQYLEVYERALAARRARA